MGEEKRRNPRVPLDVRVNCTFNAIAYAKDISEGGICLITESALEMNRILTLSFLLPEHEEALQCFGKVMWSRQATEHLFETGISFWDIKKECKEAIADYVRSAMVPLSQ